MQKLLTVIFLCLLSATALGEVIQVTEVPSKWKLENYIGDNVVAWYTSAPCENGRIILPSTTTRDDRNRFWSAVLTGKASGKEIFVRYDTTTCEIVSFGVSAQ
ncbi:hypothetical protein [Microbulbifer yueqingensis]|uniref:hypothetical protein n=1 Tax=Microbulbifer yueqingensis TaxID=658219 RepID=UPI001113EBB1|nr:hypothetical protein [Microbulbifer yueqingensis]